MSILMFGRLCRVLQCGTVAKSKTRYERNKAQRQFYWRYDNIRLQSGKSQGNNRRRKSEVVRYIYEQYAMGVYVKDIISALTEKGVFNKGKPFARNTIYNILKNEKYFGICRHNDEVFDNIYPAIVPKEVYEKVRQKTDTNKYGKRSIEVVYMLRNKMICGYC